MNNTLKNSIIFSLGAAIGSVVTWKFLAARCEARINEEVTAVKEALRNRYSDEEEASEEESDDGEDLPDIDKYVSILEDEQYFDSSRTTDEGELQYTPKDVPYVISPEEFAEFDDYEHITLFYYTDGIVSTREGDIVDDVDDIIGVDSLSHFGEYEDDAVHVRNDAKRCDYEILRSVDSYTEAIKTKPHLTVED